MKMQNSSTTSHLLTILRSFPAEKLHRVPYVERPARCQAGTQVREFTQVTNFYNKKENIQAKDRSENSQTGEILRAYKCKKYLNHRYNLLCIKTHTHG